MIDVITDSDKAWKNKYTISRIFDLIPVFQDSKKTKSLNIDAINLVINPAKNPTWTQSVY
jgi:hypothetical protein